MPDRKTHELIDKVFLGRAHPEVHKFKDAPARLLGPSHRKLFHDHITNMLLGLVYGPEAFIAGELHDLLDFSTTKLKRKNRNLQLRSKKHKRKRRKKKRKKKV